MNVLDGYTLADLMARRTNLAALLGGPVAPESVSAGGKLRK